MRTITAFVLLLLVVFAQGKCKLCHAICLDFSTPPSSPYHPSSFVKQQERATESFSKAQ
jgi:hypothetical protein